MMTSVIHYSLADRSLKTSRPFCFPIKKTDTQILLNYLEQETKFVAAIPLNDLIYKLKHINFSEYSVTESYRTY